MNGLERASAGGDLYGGDLVALAKIMVGAITLTDSNSRMNNSDAYRINEVSLSLKDDRVTVSLMMMMMMMMMTMTMTMTMTKTKTMTTTTTTIMVVVMMMMMMMMMTTTTTTTTTMMMMRIGRGGTSWRI